MEENDKYFVWLFVNKSGEELVARHEPKRIGKTKVKNLQQTLDKPGYYKKVNFFRDDNDLIEVEGTLGYNELWDHGDDWELPGYEITRETCYKWSPGLKLPQGTIEKLVGKKLTWEDEPIKYFGEQT